jgi:hypothetical protein
MYACEKWDFEKNGRPEVLLAEGKGWHAEAADTWIVSFVDDV